MKRILPFWTLFSAIILILSCGKESSYEKPLSSSSSGSLLSPFGDCLPSSSYGVFKTGSTLTAANYIEIQVSVTKTGKYLISTDTVNGFSFKGQGVFSSTGVDTVRLAGTGKPAAKGTSTFHFTYDSTTCSIDIPVVDSATAGAAVFTLGSDPSNACTSVVLSGNYKTGTPLDGSNTVTLSVNVTTPGAYSLSVSAVNGITFSKTGVFTATGAQNVVLTGSGTPANAGNFTGSLNGATNSCSFGITVTGSTPAAFALTGAPGACTSPAINGTYQAGVALVPGNTLAVKLDVATAGSYSLHTDTVDGISFSGAGTLAAGAGQTVILSGTGTPANQGTFTFTPRSGGSSCTFSLTVNAAPPVAPGVFTATIDGVALAFNDRATATTSETNPVTNTPNGLGLTGYTGPPNGNTVPELQIFVATNNGNAVQPGTYNVNGFAYGGPSGYRIEIDYTALNADSSVTIWNTSSTVISPNPPFTIVVTSATSTRVKGTFSGTLTNVFQGSTLNKAVTSGVFDLPVQ
ncbi:MAG: hypothetical protein P4L51_28705 [Puia sp.]|nr:hypothetical protein [Puia sp.]